MLIAIEGIDQAGKATQAERLCSRLTREGCNVLRRSFPEYNTPIGRVIASGLQGGEETSAEIIQLLCAANRFEFKVQMTRWSQERRIVVCDRYTASGIAYGTARGLPEDWVRRLQGAWLGAPISPVCVGDGERGERWGRQEEKVRVERKREGNEL